MMNRYKNIEVDIDNNNFKYRRNTIFPEIAESSEDLYIITSAGDRYDTLANTYYKDPSLWWVIAGVNNSKKDSLVVDPGVQLRVPMDITDVLDTYNDLNKFR